MAREKWTKRIVLILREDGHTFADGSTRFQRGGLAAFDISEEPDDLRLFDFGRAVEDAAGRRYRLCSMAALPRHVDRLQAALRAVCADAAAVMPVVDTTLPEPDWSGERADKLLLVGAWAAGPANLDAERVAQALGLTFPEPEGLTS